MLHVWWCKGNTLGISSSSRWQQIASRGEKSWFLRLITNFQATDLRSAFCCALTLCVYFYISMMCVIIMHDANVYLPMLMMMRLDSSFESSRATAGWSWSPHYFTSIPTTYLLFLCKKDETVKYYGEEGSCESLWASGIAHDVLLFSPSIIFWVLSFRYFLITYDNA